MSDVDPMVAMRAMVKTRGLQEGNARTPLEEFTGRLVAVVPRMEATNFGGIGGQRLNIDLKYDDVVVIKATEPYPFETAEITIRYSDSKNSGWGDFASTLVKFIPESMEIWDCPGTTMHMRRHTKDYGPDRNNLIDDPDNPGQKIQGRIQGTVWHVLAVQGNVAMPSSNGASAGPATEAALKVLDGKTIEEFNNEVWADPVAKSDPNLSSMLMSGAWVPAMITAGKVTVGDDGIHHVA